MTSVLTADGKLVWVTANSLRVGSLDGGKSQRDYGPQQGLVIGAAAVSQDGQYAAVSTRQPQPVANAPREGEVAIVDLHADPLTGQPSMPRFDRSNPQLKDFPDFGALAWLADDAGVEVNGLTYNEGPGPVAALFLDGMVTLPGGKWLKLSPDGRLVADAGGAACLSPSHELRVRNSVTGLVVFTVADANKAFIAQEWAPDSSALLYASYPLDPKNHPYCNDPQPTPVWWLVASSGGTPQQVADPDAARRSWYGPDIVALQCPKAQPVVIAPPANGYLSCGDPNPKGALSVGGVALGSATSVRTLGIVQP